MIRYDRKTKNHARVIFHVYATTPPMGVIVLNS